MTKSASEDRQPGRAKEGLSVGIVGTGFGGKVQAPAFLAHPRVHRVVLCGSKSDSANELVRHLTQSHPDKEVQALPNFEQLCKADIDLVSITSPPHLHHPMALSAISAGRHVLCEKPMALSGAEAEDMAQKAQKRGLIALIDHELRLNPNRQELRRLILQGQIGTPRHAHLSVQVGNHADPKRPYSWWHDQRCGGGVLGAFGSHQVDLLRHLFGEVKDVQGGLATFFPERTRNGQIHKVTADDYACFTLRFVSSVMATVVLSVVATDQPGAHLEIHGSRGALYLGQDERLVFVDPHGSRTDCSVPETLRPPSSMTTYDPLYAVSFVRLVDHLVSVLLDKVDPAPAATFEDGLAVQRILDAIRRTSFEPIYPHFQALPAGAP